jgi:DNA-binding MarR family transcriptional regulator
MSTPALPDTLRAALNRIDLSAARHRVALARLLGLSESDVLALQHIARTGRLTSARLAARLGLSSGGTTALVQRLERAGLIAREANPLDRRSRLLRLSDEAQRQLAEALEPYVHRVDTLAARLDPEALALVAGLLEDVATGAEREADALAARAEEAEISRFAVPAPGLWS